MACKRRNGSFVTISLRLTIDRHLSCILQISYNHTKLHFLSPTGHSTGVVATVIICSTINGQVGHHPCEVTVNCDPLWQSHQDGGDGQVFLIQQCTVLVPCNIVHWSVPWALERDVAACWIIWWGLHSWHCDCGQDWRRQYSRAHHIHGITGKCICHIHVHTYANVTSTENNVGPLQILYLAVLVNANLVTATSHEYNMCIGI